MSNLKMGIYSVLVAAGLGSTATAAQTTPENLLSCQVQPDGKVLALGTRHPREDVQIIVSSIGSPENFYGISRLQQDGRRDLVTLFSSNSQDELSKEAARLAQQDQALCVRRAGQKVSLNDLTKNLG